MTNSLVWLAAYYHFPATYSCRMPLSSQNAALATPGPGPSTVRLALIRAGCEVFGSQVIREEWYPIIRAAAIRVRPPERVAISQQVLQGYKGRHGESASMTGSLFYREVAQAEGALTVYVQVPAAKADPFRELLMTIGYWGQTDSLTMCLAVEEAAPNQNECALPLRLLQARSPVGVFFPSILAEFRQPDLSWEEIVPEAGGQEGSPPFSIEVYVWPLVVVKRAAGSKMLVRHSFLSATAEEAGERK